MGLVGTKLKELDLSILAGKEMWDFWGSEVQKLNPSGKKGELQEGFMEGLP